MESLTLSLLPEIIAASLTMSYVVYLVMSLFLSFGEEDEVVGAHSSFRRYFDRHYFAKQSLASQVVSQR